MRTWTLRPVGVRSTSWRAGKSVNATTHEMSRPSAVHSPISRIGRMLETASAANPTAAASVEAVTGRNLFRSANRWCSRSGTPSG